jgi:hypothetical protein
MSTDIPLLSGTATNSVATSQTTASTSYVDLATVGPAVTLVTGTKALVIITASLSNAAIAGASVIAYAVSGATTIAATDNSTLFFTSGTAGQAESVSCVQPVALTPGSNTFTLKYRVTASTGTFSLRSLVVIPLFP